MKFLIIQTAFIGDVILSLPLAQVLKKQYPSSRIDFLCIPKTSELLTGNPYIDRVIVYDKHSDDKSVSGFFSIIRKLKKDKYNYIFGVQRFLRTTLISYLARKMRTVSYNNSSLSFLYSETVNYQSKHEILRVLDLLKPLGINENGIIRPELFPSDEDRAIADDIFKGLNITSKNELVCLAPGSVWFTKRFPKEKFISLLNLCEKDKFKIVLIGGNEDRPLCEDIIKKTTNNEVYNFAGKLTLLQSAELIGRSSVLVTNDSAPLHIANAVNTKVIALFGSTVKDFGFYPIGENDKVFETDGLDCRPCTNHGKNSCKIKSFGCMNLIKVEEIYAEIKKSI